jgi:nuclear pore complex protein Nup98-Nup96
MHKQLILMLDFRHIGSRKIFQYLFLWQVDKFITADRLKIYALLAGELSWRSIKVCQDLDWKRAFALHLWYQRSSSGLVPDTMTSYENSFKGRTSTGIYAAEPSPSYLAGTQAIWPERDAEEETEQKPCRDTCYHLIKLFCKRSHRLENTLAPASYTRYQLDVSLR